MTLIKKILNAFFEPIFVHDPRTAVQWQTKPRQRRTETEPQTDKRFNVRAMKYETKTVVDKDTNEWVLHGADKTRADELTKQDIQVLKDRSIQHLETQARQIKPLWAQKFSRSQIAFELQKRKLKRGYSDGNIGKICAALSYSNGEHEAE